MKLGAEFDSNRKNSAVREALSTAMTKYFETFLIYQQQCPINLEYMNKAQEFFSMWKDAVVYERKQEEYATQQYKKQRKKNQRLLIKKQKSNQKLIEKG